jgi:hypothetical protein
MFRDHSKALRICIIAVLVGVAIGAGIQRKSASYAAPPATQPPATTSIAAAPASSPTPLAQNGESLDRFVRFSRLLNASSAEDAKVAWRAARKELLAHTNGTQAVDALRSALESGIDQRFESQLHVTSGGELLAAPTLRIYLLDLLAQVDSAEAAQYARQLLEQSTSSDEWAVALRNYSWGTDNAALDPFLRRKVRELVTNEAWIEDPTPGFLEAFDFVPYTKDPELVAPLTQLTHRAPDDSVRRSAFLALARFVAEDTTNGLQAVAAAEATQQFSPIRADAMARADFTRPGDVAAVGRYLQSQMIDPREFALFADTFPHGGQFAGAGLATTFRPISMLELAKRDAQALVVIEAWMRDLSFEQRHSELSQIYQRLQRLHESAVLGGYV